MEKKNQPLNTLNFCKMSENAIIPKKATSGSAGADLCACIDNEIILLPGKRILIPTGIAISLPGNEYVAYIFGRSGLGIKHGITLSNGVGVIDSDYRGEIKVGLCNYSEETYTISPGERIAQLIVMKVENLILNEVSELDTTERGKNGFGSTGK